MDTDVASRGPASVPASSLPVSLPPSIAEIDVLRELELAELAELPLAELPDAEVEGIGLSSPLSVAEDELSVRESHPETIVSPSTAPRHLAFIGFDPFATALASSVIARCLRLPSLFVATRDATSHLPVSPRPQAASRESRGVRAFRRPTVWATAPRGAPSGFCACKRTQSPAAQRPSTN
jgi:hypothetical protein